MRARQRHLNPRSAGANLVLDARFIDQADSTAVSAWTDRSANAYTINQSTSGYQPTFRTNQINGNPAVSFDGSDDYLTGGSILALGTNSLVVVCVAKRTSGTTGALAGRSRAANGAGRYSLLRESGNLTSLYVSATGGSNTASAAESSTDAKIFSQTISRAVAHACHGNGAQVASTSITAPDNVNHNPADTFLIGAYQSSTGGVPPLAGYYWNGLIAQIVVLFQSSFNDSMRRRLERSSGYCFKVACS